LEKAHVDFSKAKFEISSLYIGWECAFYFIVLRNFLTAAVLGTYFRWEFIVIRPLQPFFRTLTAFILFGLLEEALPAQYALAFICQFTYCHFFGSMIT